MIKNLLITMLIDHCLDILEHTIVNNLGLAPVRLSSIFDRGDLIMCEYRDGSAVLGAFLGQTDTHISLEVWDEAGEDWVVHDYPIDSFVSIECVEEDDLVYEEDLDEEQLEELRMIEGGLFPIEIDDDED